MSAEVWHSSDNNSFNLLTPRVPCDLKYHYMLNIMLSFNKFEQQKGLGQICLKA